MAIQHYKGELGEFDYDDEAFELRQGYFCDTLRYIGKETDGSKIHIPEGIMDCGCMFEDCDFLETPPAIPDSVKDCRCMFNGCKRLKVPPVIPNGVKDCHNMFWSCESIETPPVIPDSVEHCNSMFNGCHSLKTPPIIPDNVEDCSYMFYGCESLEIPPVIPDGVINCENMFGCCYSLKNAPKIPNNVKNCEDMFLGCVKFEIPPIIPNVVENCEGMFVGCESLKISPIIPDSVKFYDDMFMDCSDEIRKAGQWNIKHRGQLYEDVINKTIKKYGLSDVSKDFDLSMKMDITDLCEKCKDSNSCYNQILDDVKDGFITDSGSLKQEIEAMDKCIEQMKIDERKKQVSSEFGDIKQVNNIQAEY